jgi:APA family basic amino acid/polyamine antiporter
VVGDHEPLVCSHEPLAHVLRARPPADGQRHRHRRRAGPAHRHPDDDLRPDPHLLHDVARWPAAGPLSKIHPKFSAAHHHHHHRHRGVAVLGDVPGRRAGRHLQLRHLVRLHHGVHRRAGAARAPAQPAAPFRTPFAWPVCILAIAGCILLFVNLSVYTIALFFGWAAIGLVVYFLYGYRKAT